MAATPLDLSVADLAEVDAEVKKALPVLLSALEVAEKFGFLFPPLKAALDTAIPVLEALEAIVDKT